MNYTYLLHPLAEHDYVEAYNWYEDRQQGLGERFIESVRVKLQAIADRPEAYGARNNRNFREALIDDFPYLIVYRVNKRKKQILISSVHYTGKSPRKKYRR